MPMLIGSPQTYTRSSAAASRAPRRVSDRFALLTCKPHLGTPFWMQPLSPTIDRESRSARIRCGCIDFPMRWHKAAGIKAEGHLCATSI